MLDSIANSFHEHLPLIGSSPSSSSSSTSITSKKWIGIVLIVSLLGILGGGGYYAYTTLQGSSSSSSTSIQTFVSTRPSSSSSSTGIVVKSSSSSSSSSRLFSSSSSTSRSSSSSSSTGARSSSSTSISSSSSAPSIVLYNSSTGAPNFAQRAPKLIGSGSIDTPGQGYTVAVSADGYTVAVGGYTDNGSIGAVWIFVYTDLWSQQGNKLTATGMTGAANVGGSVSLSDDGNTLAVGGFSDNNGVGAVWIFVRNNGVWAQQGTKLLSSHSGGGSQFGTSVCLSSDGNRLAVGSPGEDSANGNVYTFARSGSTWSLDVVIPTPSDIQGPTQFGGSLSFSLDGNTLAIGGGQDNSYTGATWIFKRGSGGTWSQQGSKLVGTGCIGPPCYQGVSVSLSSDANTLAVGGLQDHGSIGAVWMFINNGTYQQQGTKIVPTDLIGGATPYFGGVVALSGDGNTLVTSADGDNANQGAGFVYIRNGTHWDRFGPKLIGNGAVGNPQFGWYLAFSRNAETIAFGGAADGGDFGATWIFMQGTDYCAQNNPCLHGGLCYNTAHNATCSCINGYSGSLCEISHCDGALAPCNGNGTCIHTPSSYTCNCTASYDPTTHCSTCLAGYLTEFNCAVPIQEGSKILPVNYGSAPAVNAIALSVDGSTMVVGGPNDGIGFVYVFTRSAGTSTQVARFSGSGSLPGHGVHIGSSIAMDASGTTIAAGAPNDGSSNNGAVWIFTGSGSSWSQQAKLTGTGGSSSSASQGNAVALSADGNTLAMAAQNDGSQGTSGVVWIHTRAGGTWTQQTMLVPTGAVGTAINFGRSVALSEDGTTLAVGGPLDNSGVGATWIFTQSGGTWTLQGSKLTASDANADAGQGSSVALAQNGNLLVVGGSSDSSNNGALFTFTRSAGVWTYQGSKLTPSGSSEAGSQLGLQVSLSSNGNVLVASGSIYNTGEGALWNYERSGNAWIRTPPLIRVTGQITTPGNFGSGISINGNGNVIAATAKADNSNTGAIFVFV